MARVELLQLRKRRQVSADSEGMAGDPAVSSIFVSYRRDDSVDVCGRITDHLIDRFGRSAIFKDVDSLHGGDQFPARLRDALQQCDVALVVIGPRWLSVTGASGLRRLDEPGDFVRYEIEEMLRRRIPILPILVQGATMPDLRLLPPAIAALSAYPPLVVRPDPYFRGDMHLLTTKVREQVRLAEGKHHRVVAHPLLALAALLGLLATAADLEFQLPNGTVANTVFGALFVATFAFTLIAVPYQAIAKKRWAWLGLFAVSLGVTFGLWTAFPHSPPFGEAADAALLAFVLAFSVLSPRFSLLPRSLRNRVLA